MSWARQGQNLRAATARNYWQAPLLIPVQGLTDFFCLCFVVKELLQILHPLLVSDILEGMKGVAISALIALLCEDYT